MTKKIYNSGKNIYHCVKTKMNGHIIKANEKFF